MSLVKQFIKVDNFAHIINIHLRVRPRRNEYYREHFRAMTKIMLEARLKVLSESMQQSLNSDIL